MSLLGILAHQGGWDELLMVGVPVMLFGGMLWVARRRALEEAARAGNADQSDSA